MSDYIKVGALCGDKYAYKDGVGYCIWYPFEEDQNMGICFDFSADDMDSLVELLRQLKDAKANEVEE
jgi:hypothetical protein